MRFNRAELLIEPGPQTAVAIRAAAPVPQRAGIAACTPQPYLMKKANPVWQPLDWALLPRPFGLVPYWLSAIGNQLFAKRYARPLSFRICSQFVLSTAIVGSVIFFSTFSPLTIFNPWRTPSAPGVA